MKFAFAIICSVILSAFSLKESSQKFCIHCKHFKNTLRTDATFGKCALFPTEQNQLSYLVSGSISDFEAIQYRYCSTVRTQEDMCGKEGKLYERKSPNRILSAMFRRNICE